MVNLQGDPRHEFEAVMDASFEIHPAAVDLSVNVRELALVTLDPLVEIGKLVQGAIPVLLQNGELASILLAGVRQFLFESRDPRLLRLLAGLDPVKAGLHSLYAAIQLRLQLALLAYNEFACLVPCRLQP